MSNDQRSGSSDPTKPDGGRTSPFPSGSFIRWQSITIAQLGYAANLLLAFATTSIGFGFSFVRESSFTPNCAIRIVFGTSLCLLLASVGVGLFCACNRLRDFRMTAAIAHDRETLRREWGGEWIIKHFLSQRRKEARALGRRTWLLFRAQAVLFFFGMLLLIAALATVYWTKV